MLPDALRSLHRLLRHAAARLVTGPAAFGLAGALDLALIGVLLARYARSRRYHARRDAG